MKKVAVVIVAAGSGNRFCQKIPKQYHLLDGKPILQKTIDEFLTHPQISEVIVVIGEVDQLRYETCHRTDAKLHPPVIGGATRQASVFEGLKALKKTSPDLVLIHDAARPFVSKNLIDRVIDSLKTVPGCIPALPIIDTIKRTHACGQLIEKTISRDQLWLAQTPQGFHYLPLLNAHEQFQNSSHFTDDASLFEALALPVAICAGEISNIKITYPKDLI